MKKVSLILASIIFAATTITFPIQKVKAANSITRAKVEERALNMINLTWTYSKSKNSNIDSKYTSLVTMPKQFNNITTAKVTGIPYNWGGLDSLDTSSDNAPWSNFLDAVNKGAYAGNVNTESGYGLIGGTTGIDCSGFVQAAFNINDYKLSTSTLFNKYFVKINLSDIKHMDILDRPGDHVVIFDKWGTLNGVYGAFTYESTPDQFYGGIQGTKKYFLTMKDINNGYIAGRYVNIDDSNAGYFAKVVNVNDFANLRLSPSTNSSLIGTVPKGTILYLIDYSSGWYQVKYNGQVAWIYGGLVSPIESGKYVNLSGAYALNIRMSPSTNSSIIGSLLTNQYAEVLDYSVDGKWMKLRINGVEGWSSSQYLRYIY